MLDDPSIIIYLFYSLVNFILLHDLFWHSKHSIRQGKQVQYPRIANNYIHFLKATRVVNNLSLM